MAVERESSVQLPDPVPKSALIFKRPALAQAGKQTLLFRGAQKVVEETVQVCPCR